ncbi:TonB-dependent receptor [candidate division KSB1 bacterium]|nr:TonB-dependent receptor [candidate division KSB1 bacterium]
MNVKIKTASRSAKSVRELPSTVFIITREDILNNNYFTLVDALKDIPNIKVSQPGTGTHGEKYVMRGLYGNNYAKIFIDGIPVRPSAVDGMPIGEQINMKNVERIEVVYGPVSALYGADALAGIINIITYNPGENTARLEASAGTAGYMSTRFYVNQMKNDLKLNIYGGYSERDDYNIDKSGGAVSDTTLYGDIVKVGKLPSKSQNIGFELSYKDLYLSLDHMYRNDHSSLEQDSQYYIWDNPDLLYGETVTNASMKYDFNVGKTNFNSVVSYLRYRLDTKSAFGMIFYPNPLYKYTASDDILFEETVVFNLSRNFEMVGGLSFLYSGAMPKSNDLIKAFDEDFYKPFSKDIPKRGEYQSQLLGDFGWNPLVYYNVGGFIQGTYSTDKYTVLLGMRYDDHSEYKSKFNPRIAGLYNISQKTSMRAAYNEAFRAPSPYRVYNAIAVDNGNGSIYYMHIPNEELEPEEFSAVEFGLRHMFSKNISLELVGYHNKISGLMTSGLVKLNPQKYPLADREYANADVNSRNAKSVLNGLDCILGVNNICKPSQLNINFYFSYMKGEETLPNGDKIDVFRNIPEYLAKFRVNGMPIKNLYVGIDNIYCGEWYGRVYSKADLEIPDRKSDGYYTMDITAYYQIGTVYGNFKLNLRIDNVFNASYGGHRYRDNPQYKKTIYGGLEFYF